MRIVVAYKWAADPQEATVAPEGTVDWSRAKAGISEYDPPAFEIGRRLADAEGAELIGLTAGGPDAAAPMARKAALARGLDRVVVVADESLRRARSTRTGLVLAAAVRALGEVDLVLAGESSIDVGAQLVPAILAGALGWPALAQVRSVSGRPGALRIERAHRGGSQVLSATGPVVASVAPDAVAPRLPGMKDILAAGRKPTEELPLASLAVRPSATVTVAGAARPPLPARAREIFRGDPEAAARQLASALHAAGLA